MISNPSQQRICPSAGKLLRLVGEVARRAGGVSHAQSDFSLFFRPVYVVRGCLRGHVGVRPPPPLRGSSPCEAGQFCHPHGEKRVVTPPAAWRTEEALRPRTIYGSVRKVSCVPSSRFQHYAKLYD